MSDETSDTQAPQHLERLDPNERSDHQAAQHWARYEWAAGLLPAGRVLDCSCGVGYGTALLRKRGAERIVGVDISPDAIALARQRYGLDGIEYVQSNALDLTPEKLGTFDLIVSLETIEHVSDPQALLDVFRGLLNPGGMLALSCPNDAHLGVDNPYHLWKADHDTLCGWLRQRFAKINAYAEVHTFGAAVWPVGQIESRPEPSRRYEVPTRLVDQMPIASAPGFLFACGDPSCRDPAPFAAQVLDAHGYLRERDRAREDMWEDAQRIGEAWEAQTARVKELDAVRDKLWSDLQQMREAWESQGRRITELEAARADLAKEAHRLGQAWEAQTARVKELDELKDRLWNELQGAAQARARLEQELAQLNRRPLYRALSGVKLLPKMRTDNNTDPKP